MASAITSYARIHLHKVMVSVGDGLCYVDTDSIISEKSIDKNLLGDGIGA
jgi:hypothetical protein